MYCPGDVAITGVAGQEGAKQTQKEAGPESFTVVNSKKIKMESHTLKVHSQTCHLSTRKTGWRLRLAWAAVSIDK